MIRVAREEDTTILNNLLTELIQDEKQYNNNINPDFKVTDMYQRYINDDSRLILVYEIDNKIVGYIYGYIDDSPVTIKNEAVLDALYVVSNYRNNGIASELIDEFIKWCKKEDAYSIELGVLLRNTKAKRLYENKNFKPVSARLKYII